MNVQLQLDSYFAHLSQKLPVVTRNGKQMHVITSKWKDVEEIYYLRPQDMHDMLLEVILEVPQAYEYKAAIIALLFAEQKYLTGEIEFQCPYPEWLKLRHEITNPLSTTGGLYIKDQLKNLGINPTFYLHDDPKASSYRCSLLLNRLWRTKEDFMAKRTLLDIRKLILEELWNDPQKAIVTNPYIYSALIEHCTLMLK